MENPSLRGVPIPLERAISRESPRASPLTPRIRSGELFGEGRRIIIEHEGREYSLLITRQGKLILNRC